MGTHNHHGLLMDQSVINASYELRKYFGLQRGRMHSEEKDFKKSIAFSQQLIEQLDRISTRI